MRESLWKNCSLERERVREKARTITQLAVVVAGTKTLIRFSY